MPPLGNTMAAREIPASLGCNSVSIAAGRPAFHTSAITGVRGSRHFSFRSGLGATMLDSGPGVRITHVVPGGFAAEAGMQAGDLLLRLNGASVLHLSDVGFVAREHAPGEEIAAEYVRGGEVLSGNGPLSEWNYGDGRYVGHPGGYPKASLTGA